MRTFHLAMICEGCYSRTVPSKQVPLMNEHSQRGELQAPCVNYGKLKCSVLCKQNFESSKIGSPERRDKSDEIY